MELKVDWLKNNHELEIKVFIFFISGKWSFGGWIEEGECWEQEVDRNAHRDVWELQFSEKTLSWIYEKQSSKGS